MDAVTGATGMAAVNSPSPSSLHTVAVPDMCVRMCARVSECVRMCARVLECSQHTAT